MAKGATSQFRTSLNNRKVKMMHRVIEQLLVKDLSIPFFTNSGVYGWGWGKGFHNSFLSDQN